MAYGNLRTWWPDKVTCHSFFGASFGIAIIAECNLKLMALFIKCDHSSWNESKFSFYLCYFACRNSLCFIAFFQKKRLQTYFHSDSGCCWPAPFIYSTDSTSSRLKIHRHSLCIPSLFQVLVLVTLLVQASIWWQVQKRLREAGPKTEKVIKCLNCSEVLSSSRTDCTCRQGFSFLWCVLELHCYLCAVLPWLLLWALQVCAICTRPSSSRTNVCLYDCTESITEGDYLNKTSFRFDLLEIFFIQGNLLQLHQCAFRRIFMKRYGTRRYGNLFSHSWTHMSNSLDSGKRKWVCVECDSNTVLAQCRWIFEGRNSVGKTVQCFSRTTVKQASTQECNLAEEKHGHCICNVPVCPLD